jgi:hypothetical protein
VVDLGPTNQEGRPAVEYIGIDVHQRESQVCIVDEDGQVLLERRVRTRGERFAALSLRKRGGLVEAPDARMVGTKGEYPLCAAVFPD